MASSCDKKRFSLRSRRRFLLLSYDFQIFRCFLWGFFSLLQIAKICLFIFCCRFCLPKIFSKVSFVQPSSCVRQLRHLFSATYESLWRCYDVHALWLLLARQLVKTQIDFVQERSKRYLLALNSYSSIGLLIPYSCLGTSSWNALQGLLDYTGLIDRADLLPAGR